MSIGDYYSSNITRIIKATLNTKTLRRPDINVFITDKIFDNSDTTHIKIENKP